MNRKAILSPEEFTRLMDALNGIREKIYWKSGKDIAHFEKRFRMGHLAVNSTLADYEKIISHVVKDEDNALYLYEINQYQYYAVRGTFHDQVWLIIFGSKGLMETAFPPVDIEDYMERRGFILLGRIREVLQWKDWVN